MVKNVQEIVTVDKLEIPQNKSLLSRVQYNWKFPQNIQAFVWPIEDTCDYFFNTIK